MDTFDSIKKAVKLHYEKHVYPEFPLFSSIRLCDAYALNVDSLWARFNGERSPPSAKKILLAGCGSFSPYPTAMANKEAEIIALDLSRKNLDRARLHTLIHRCFNVSFIEGDLTKPNEALKKKHFHFIDCYGVLHHIPEAASALKTIYSLSASGALIRLMVYSTCARRSAQSIRTAMKMLHIHEVGELRNIYRKAKDDSRFKQYMDSAYEARFDSGIADMFLHPYAKTYTIDQLLEFLDMAGFEPLMFIHRGALSDVESEIERLKDLENQKALYTNFTLLIGRKEDAARRAAWMEMKNKNDTIVLLNTVIKKSLPLIPWIPLKPDAKLGFDNPVIDRYGNTLLKRFKEPVKKSSINASDLKRVEEYIQAMFLVEIADR